MSSVTRIPFTLTDYQIELRAGNVPGRRVVNIQGFAVGMGTTEQQTWSNASDLDLGLQDSAQQVQLASTSEEEAATRTGARTVVLQGLDSNGDEQQELIIMTGLTAVTSTLTYSAVNGLVPFDFGSAQTDVGDIWCGNGVFTLGIPDIKYATVRAGDAIGKFGAFTVPRAKELFVTQVTLMIADTNKVVNLTLRFFDGIAKRVIAHFPLAQGDFGARADAAPVLRAGSIVFMTGSVTSTTADVSVLIATELHDI